MYSFGVKVAASALKGQQQKNLEEAVELLTSAITPRVQSAGTGF